MLVEPDPEITESERKLAPMVEVVPAAPKVDHMPPETRIAKTKQEGASSLNDEQVIDEVIADYT